MKPSRPPAPSPLRLTALADVPPVEPGDDLPALLGAAARSAGVRLSDGVLVVCQKIVSKAEGRLVSLADVEPSPRAREIAERDGKDPRHVELVLRESARMVRHEHGVMICETRHGFVCANAGVDLSNSPGPDVAVLLPEDCDASAEALRAGLAALGSEGIAVIVSDTFGRPWREGLVDVAVGCAGIAAMRDVRGEKDWAGRELQMTMTATVDQLAAAAGLLMIKDAGVPAVWIEGVPGENEGRARGEGTERDEGSVQAMLRDPSEDLFR